MDSRTLPHPGHASVNSTFTKETGSASGPQPGWALEGEMPISLAILPATFRPLCFLCSRPDPSIQGFYKEDKCLFTGGLNQGLQPRSKWESKRSSHLLFENWRPGPGIWDKSHHPPGTIPSPSKLCGKHKCAVSLPAGSVSWGQILLSAADHFM